MPPIHRTNSYAAAGFSIGWLYWFFWVVVLAVEATAGAKILEGWIPAVPRGAGP